MQIGFIGLGIMGRPMAEHLLKAGYCLMVCNRTAGKTKPLVELGAEAAGSPAELAAACEVIITMVSDTPDVEEVLFGKGGVSEGLAVGKIVIDMSTISPAATENFAARLRAASCEMLDAPVSGGEPGARAATLTIMVGGRREVFEKCQPIFATLGRNIVYCGSSGNGQRTKLVNQVICALNILAMTEGLRLAKLTGLDLQTTLQAVSGGAAGSWMLSNLAPRILKNDFAPGFTIRLQSKDLRLAMELMQSLGKEFPGTALTHQLFQQAVAKGLGGQGTQGLINLFAGT
ncbi:MAG: NAD(P)-dependent oxidoreductase [candidate division KSB1 bacterium]|nr:NAD(P)-dependent oxidoreductase [candidate division KSB1 bacterium]MDZ7273691.1 NAD(P)-dependent oxidoreductase [candidate division KSB1 bacterium]MDZ7285847.1 NAD(P)-dependent oxidoreductase [candidate division KSB1 bacterium]MDZ7298879.1 NAD(P)-dependent oxidoreductase [candidate division KSB1 bacterium]MDZ7307075.1 NAD(P)-dependent oxidoreductase [candidate division KSB1 bacterium]